MELKLRILSFIRNLFSFLFIVFAVSGTFITEIICWNRRGVLSGKEISFTTNNSFVEVADNGSFSMEAGAVWGSASEYVLGEVTAIGSGTTVLPVGNNGVYAPVTMNHTTDVSASYVNASPTSGSNGVNVEAVSTIEYWKMTGTAIVKLPWNENSDITSLVNNNGGSQNSVAIVGLSGGEWNLISDSQTSTVSGDLLNGEVSSDLNTAVVLDGFGEFTFGIDRQIVLSVNDLFLSKGIAIRSNPVRNGEENIVVLAI